MPTRFLKRLACWGIVKTIAPTVKVRFSTAEDTAYIISERAININLNDTDDCGFLRHIDEVHGFHKVRDYSLLLWSVLHELGHHFTPYADDDLETRIICALIPKDKAQQSIELQDMYFNIENEYEATEWAINYIKAHPIRCRAFNRILR